MLTGSLFAGIGALELGVAAALDAETVWQVEFEPYCQKILERRFPRAELYGDVHDCGAHNLSAVDLIVGGFPCQPASVAGKKLGTEDVRWLWPEFARILRELSPRFAFIENVPGLLSVNDGTLFGIVLADLHALGYAARWTCIKASDVGAPHRRERVFIAAMPLDDTVLMHPVAMIGPDGWRAPQTDLFGADAAIDWPKHGMMQKGRVVAYPAAAPTRHVAGWPTPQARDAKGPFGNHSKGGRDLASEVLWSTPTASAASRGDAVRGRNAQGGPSLGEQVASESLWSTPVSGGGNRNLPTDVSLWPPPVTTDAKGARRATARTEEWTANEGTTLTDAVWMAMPEWPTPSATTYGSSGNGCPGDGRETYAHAGKPSLDGYAKKFHGGALNPDWVELLMGLPIGWTDAANASQLRSDTGAVLQHPGWPAPPGPDQYDYEPPRALKGQRSKTRRKRLKALGNAVVHPQAEAAARHLFRSAQRCALRGD